MFKTTEDGSRQIHLKVPENVHRKLKIMAAMGDQSINEMLATKVISILLAGQESKETTVKE